MAIHPYCIKCRKELDKSGGIIFTSPMEKWEPNPVAPKGWPLSKEDEDLKELIELVAKINKKGYNLGIVNKYHICQECEKSLAEWMLGDLFKNAD